MFRKKLEEIELFNSSIPQDKYKKHKCFYCKQRGHIIKSCPVKTKNDAELTENHSKESAKGNKEEIKPTQPKVSIKYPEFNHFKTRGILKGTDQSTWDDLWYLSSTTDKHLCNNLNFLRKIKENFLVEKLEDQMKFLFTYGLGEVVIKNDNQGYLIPGVHYAPEVTLNILSIDLLHKQGFETFVEEDS
nr:ARID DNA-binding domain-containing protein [Tanacetum cinerariifolium]